MVEARGVEPLSEPPSSEASPCVVDDLISASGCHRQHSLHPVTCGISPSTREPGQLASLVVSSARLPDITGRTSRCLGRESELVRVCFCLFDPVFNEEHGSSSACSPELKRSVETETPPFGSARSLPCIAVDAMRASFLLKRGGSGGGYLSKKLSSSRSATLR
jgi:hypothetical protein